MRKKANPLREFCTLSVPGIDPVIYLVELGGQQEISRIVLI